MYNIAEILGGWSKKKCKKKKHVIGRWKFVVVVVFYILVFVFRPTMFVRIHNQFFLTYDSKANEMLLTLRLRPNRGSKNTDSHEKKSNWPSHHNQ